MPRIYDHTRQMFCKHFPALNSQSARYSQPQVQYNFPAKDTVVKNASVTYRFFKLIYWKPCTFQRKNTSCFSINFGSSKQRCRLALHCVTCERNTTSFGGNFFWRHHGAFPPCSHYDPSQVGQYILRTTGISGHGESCKILRGAFWETALGSALK